MATRYVAGASGLPFGVLRGYVGTDLVDHTATIAPITCPFTGEMLTAVPALKPDVAVIHAQQADREGNVQLWGLVGVQKEAVLAAQRADRDRRGDRRRARAHARTPSCCRRGSSTPCATCRAAPIPASRWATARATTSFYRAWDDDLARPRHVHRPGSTSTCAAPPTSPSTAAAPASSREPLVSEQRSADDLMIVSAARHAGPTARVCFVGIGLPSTAANLARRLHAPDCVLIYESGCIGSKPTRLPLSIGDGELADTADAVVIGARDLRLLAAGRTRRRRLPRRRAARPVRQHQLDRDRRLRASDHAPARRRRRARDRGIGRRGHRHHAPERRARSSSAATSARRSASATARAIASASACAAEAPSRHHRPRHPPARSRDRRAGA